MQMGGRTMRLLDYHRVISGLSNCDPFEGKDGINLAQVHPSKLLGS